MDIYNLKGKIYKVFPIQQKSDRFKKREIIVQVTNPTDKGVYVEYIRLQCINDKIDLIRDAEKGNQVVCRFSITGTKTGKADEEIFYTNLNVIDLTIINNAADIIRSDIKPGSADYKDQFPGFDDDENDGFAGAPPTTEKDDLPF